MSCTYLDPLVVPFNSSNQAHSTLNRSDFKRNLQTVSKTQSKGSKVPQLVLGLVIKKPKQCTMQNHTTR